MTEDFKPKISGAEFVEKLKEAGFTEKTIEALQEEDVVSDTSLKILSEKDIETLADEKRLTIGQKRLLLEFAATLKPKPASPERYRRSHRSSHSRGRASSSSKAWERGRSRSPLSDRRRHDGDRLNPEQSTCIGIFNLPTTTKASTLHDIFSRIGYVKDVKIVFDRITGLSRGFAFIYFRDLETAVYAKETCAGMSIEGSVIRTEYSITKRPHSPTPGAYLGKPSRDHHNRFNRTERGRPSSDRYEPSNGHHRSSYSNERYY